MKALFILPHYHAVTSANNICMNKLMYAIRDEGGIVDVLCTDVRGSSSTINFQQGIRIISIRNIYNAVLGKTGKYFTADSFDQLPRLIQLATRAFCYITTIGKPFTDYYAVDAISRRKIKELIDESYDVIISHSHPFAAHLIASDLKKAGIANKWIAVLWDPFVYNCMDSDEEIPKRKKAAERVLRTADCVFAMDGIMQYNYANGWVPSFNERVREMHLPTLTEKCCKMPEPIQDNYETVITFAGAFYNTIREPNVALDILSELPNNYSVHLYGSGCRRIINEKASLFTSSKLKDYGVVSHDECEKAIHSANILLNIGNTVPNQLPSKVFEYISYGKPILNFYFREDDIGLQYLRKYPLCYNINLNTYTRNDVNALIAFCERYKHKTITFAQATENLMEYRAERIIDGFLKEITI